MQKYREALITLRVTMQEDRRRNPEGASAESTFRVAKILGDRIVAANERPDLIDVVKIEVR